MATEGGGRHSPSTFFWEEEGVPAIVRIRPTSRVGPKVTDFPPPALPASGFVPGRPGPDARVVP